jgi:hypothetical protein
MSTASTAKPPPKRVRIDTDNTPVYDYTPIAGSVSTLLPVMKDIVKRYYDLFIKICKKIHDKQNIIKKLAIPDFIPRSAKSNFHLGVSDKVKMSTQYTDLAQAAEQVTNAFEKKQKQHIKQVAALEVEAMEKERQSNFIEGLFEITSMMYLWKTINDDIIEKDIHHIIHDIIQRDDSLLLYVFKAKYKDFVTAYNTVYPLSLGIITQADTNNTNNEFSDDIEIPRHALQATIDQYFPGNNRTNNQQLLSTQDTQTVTTAASTQASLNDDDDGVEVIMQYHPLHEADLCKLTRILKDVYVHSWSTELKNIENRLLEAKMTKFTKARLLTKATDEAAEIVANEPAASMQQLDEIINKKVEAKTKQLTKEFQSKLQHIMRTNKTDDNKSKNSSRRERNNRADKNKSKTNRTRSNSNNSQRSKSNQPNGRTPTPKQRNNTATTNSNHNNGRKRKNNGDKKSNNNSLNPQQNGQRPQQRGTPRRQNQNRNQNRADESRQDSQGRKGSNKRGRNRNRSSSNNRNKSTESKRPRNRPN